MTYSNPGDPGIGGYPDHPPATPPTLESLSSQLHTHEGRSQARYEELCSKLTSKEHKMGMDNVSDKVNINVGDGGGSGGMAALIAAMNSGGGDNNIPALIAAMGNQNRNQDGGMNSMWPILLLALLGGRGRGGLFGGGDDCGPVAAGGVSPGQAALLQTILENAAATRAAVPQTALETQIGIQTAVGALALGTQQGFANTGDKVQAALLAELAAISGTKDTIQNVGALLSRDICNVQSTVQTEACATRELVQAGTTAVLSRIDRAEIDELRANRDRFERQVEINNLRSTVEVNQTVNQTQAQAQTQSQWQVQFQDIGNVLRRLNDRIDIVHQEQRSTNANIIAGNTGAVVTGAQTSTPTNVNAR